MYLSLFTALDHFLLEHASLWRNQPFTQLWLEWETRYPELSTWLRARSLEHAEQHQLEPARLASSAVPEPFARWASLSRQLTVMEHLPRYSTHTLPEAMARGIPGRKWQQIEAFAACLPDDWQGSRWLDWCAGKGHLGRRLAWPDGCLRCIEHDPTLVEAGQQLSQRWSLQAEHIQCDALSAAAQPYLASSDGWAALHACGDLHTHLLRSVGQHSVRHLALAPCCYNRTTRDLYQPLSAAGRASALRLTPEGLGLPLQATVTAGRGEVRKRNRMMAWRLGFDLLQRQWRDEDDYLSVPSAVSRWTELSFADWCCAVAELKAVVVRPGVDWAAAEQAGWQRLAQVRNLELVQGLFRRPLELWLLLDMALYLQEKGFDVQLGEFCPQQLTPRNLLLLAAR